MMRQHLIKLLILVGIFTSAGISFKAHAQYYGYGSVTSVVGLNPYYWPKSYVAAYGINQVFQAVQEGWTLLEQGKAVENEINARRSNLENYKSVQRFYNEGIPAFAPIAPNGKPRSPKITWQDVESIR